MSAPIEIKQWAIGRVKPCPTNPRKIGEKAIAAVAGSIKEFGFKNPIIVDRDGVIITGHTRLLAAKSLGMKQVPVVTATDLSPEQARAYRLADNRVAEFSEWDRAVLVSELGQPMPEMEFASFDELLKELPDDPDSLTGGDPDAVPDVVKGKSKSKRGEVYELGGHRLMCGDSTSSEDVGTLMQGARVSLLLTDPPYNVAYTGRAKDALTIDNDEMDDVSFRKFLGAALSAIIGWIDEGASFYIWHADLQGYAFRGACADVGLRVRQCLVWAKNVMVMGRSDYHWKHEPCLYGWKDGASHTWLSDRTQTTLLEFDRPSRSTEHPTMKPVELFEYQIRNSCPVGGVVADVFGGSGTALIAAAKCSRLARLMELDPHYCDVIRRRWTIYALANGIEPGPGALEQV